MKKTTLCTLIAASMAPGAVLADANCAHSNSWQCQQAHQSAIQAAHETHPDNVLAPHTALPGTTTPAVGSLPTDHHNVALKPKPVAQAIPKPMATAGSSKPTKKPMPVATPSQVLPPQETPHTVVTVTGTQTTVTGYGKVPEPVTGTVSGFTGYGPVPQTVTGSQAAFTGYGPVPQPTTLKPPAGQTTTPHNGTPVIVQTPAGTSGGNTPGASAATHQLVVHEPPAQKPVASGHHANPAAEYNLEFIEPGIQNHKVEVYRSKDAQQAVYNDTIPQDHGDFHLVVVGIRNPDYIH